MLQRLDVTFDKLMNDVEMKYRGERTESLDIRLIKNKDEQHQIVDLMVKISWLTIVSQIFQQIWIYVAFYYTVFFLDKKESDYGVFAVCRMLRNVWILITCAVLYLIFVFNQQQYDKCCLKCHRCLKNCCIKWIYRNKIRTYNNRT